MANTSWQQLALPAEMPMSTSTKEHVTCALQDSTPTALEPAQPVPTQSQVAQCATIQLSASHVSKAIISPAAAPVHLV